MKTLFSDIYNKLLELFQIEKSENTSEAATNRLKVILMHDRTKLDPLIMNKMREELIEVFSKYVVINKEELEIDLENNGDAAALMLNIPIIRSKTEEELEIGLKNEGDAVALMLNIPVVRSKTEEELEEIRRKLQEEETKVSDSDDEEDEDASEDEEEVISEEDEIVEEDEEKEDKE